MKEKDFLLIVKENNAHAYLVGGAVRDKIIGVAANDKDYVITGFTEEKLLNIFPKARKIGSSFPVYLLKLDGIFCEISLARKEVKNGEGYRGFDVVFTPDILIEEDLYRRDLTMNAIAFDPLVDLFIDPYGGIDDIRKKILKAVSEHFVEDPVRALRAARQSAQFDFVIDELTVSFMKKCKDELLLEPKERILTELSKALSTKKPSIFFKNMNDASLLEYIFPWLFNLIGKSQPVKYHPEGDAYKHTMLVLDRVSSDTSSLEARFAALMHDIGKGVTPSSILPHHYGHDVRGLKVLDEIRDTLKISNLWYYSAKFVIKEHMRANRLVKLSKIVDLLIKIKDFISIVSADNNGKLVNYLKNYDEYFSVISDIVVECVPDNLKGKEVGEWLFRKKVAAFTNYLEKKRGD
ncbi:MAG: HD domain-containing protein [Synergistaceae bacterium]